MRRCNIKKAFALSFALVFIILLFVSCKNKETDGNASDTVAENVEIDLSEYAIGAVIISTYGESKTFFIAKCPEYAGPLELPAKPIP